MFTRRSSQDAGRSATPRVRSFWPDVLRLTLAVIFTLSASFAWDKAFGAEAVNVQAAAKKKPYTPIFQDTEGRAARWNPCSEIRWAYNPVGEQGIALPDVKASVRSISSATGMKFKYVGSTASKPGAKIFPETFDLRVGWAKPNNRAYTLAKYKPVKGYEVEGTGLAYVQARTYLDGRFTAPEIVRGEVILNPEATFTPNGRRLTLMHELGHALGLDHFSDEINIMYPYIQETDEAKYGPGDLAGLKKLGKSAGCFAYPIR